MQVSGFSEIRLLVLKTVAMIRQLGGSMPYQKVRRTKTNYKPTYFNGEFCYQNNIYHLLNDGILSI